MTVQTHQVSFDVPTDYHRAIVYYDNTPPSLDTLDQILAQEGQWTPPFNRWGYRLSLQGTRVDFLAASAQIKTLPPHLRTLVPGPPLDDPLTFPHVVVVYEGDVVSWQGHDPTRLDAWILDPESVRGHLTRSSDRVASSQWDAEPPTCWAVNPTHLIEDQA